MHKNTKAACAATAAAVLLLGGASTMASWNDSKTIAGGAIKSGSLSLTQETGQTCTAWTLDGAGGGGAFVPGTTLVVPGDVITRTCTYTVNATGEHLAATVGLASPSFDETNDLVSALTADADYTIDADPLEDPAAATIADGAAITSANDGDVLSAAVSVTFSSATAGTTAQEMTATLDALTVSLTQTHA
ncbi:alternate-type signal peptide domain-containing protein [Nocardioides astragali]|uniref:Alternate-type signal peptide domain-containing protein n=1 Tax=Nocardioides astragali TaxID=1776736 RepID=A0ABW2N0U9_9ACTN|nr:alternate-type signal peptide domain-containing protein [Nocardioides astragali]